jgi:hypothetical protein
MVKDYIPYVVSAIAPTAPPTLGLVDAGLHAAAWIAVLILEIMHYTQVHGHATDAKVTAGGTHPHALHSYDAVAAGSLVTLLIAGGLVVALLLLHSMLQFEEARVPPSLLGIVVGCARASVALTVVLQLLFLADGSGAGHVASDASWLGEPGLWVALLTTKLVALSMLTANVFFAGPGAHAPGYHRG